MLLPAAAAARSTKDAELRLTASAVRPVAGRLSFGISGQARLSDNASRLGQIRLGGSLEHELAPGIVASLGYNYMHFFADAKPAYNGHRFSETIGYPLSGLGGARLSGRTRLEQGLSDNGSGAQHRLRQAVHLTVPLPGIAGLRGVIDEEIFLQLRARGSSPAGLSQLRSFVGVSAPMAAGLTLRTGYLNRRSFPGDDRVDHILDLRLQADF